MAAAGVAALIPALGSLFGNVAGAFANQGRSPLAGSAAPGPRVDTSSAAIAAAPDEKRARMVARNAEKERIYALLTDPQVLGLATVLGSLVLANRIRFAQDPGTNARVQGVAAASGCLMGLGRAGVGDLTSLVMAGMAGAATGGPESVSDLIPGGLGALPLLALPGGVGFPLVLGDWFRGEFAQ